MANNHSAYNKAATKLLHRNKLDCINEDHLDIPDYEDMAYITVTVADSEGFIEVTTEYPEDNEAILEILAEFVECSKQSLAEVAEVLHKNESGVITYRLPDKCQIADPAVSFCELALKRASNFINIARIYDGNSSGRDDEFSAILEEVETLSDSFAANGNDG